MKKIHLLTLIISFLILSLFFSALSMINLPAEFRYTWAGMNPLNGIYGVMYTFQNLFSLGKIWTYVLTIVISLFLWWRLYSLVKRMLP